MSASPSRWFELVELRVVEVAGVVAEADDVERHLGEPLEIGRLVDAAGEVLREIQVALDHAPLPVAPVGRSVAQTAKPRARRELSGPIAPSVGRGSSGRGR